MKKGIFLYDFLVVKGGAESLAITLLNDLKNYDFCVAYSDPAIFSQNERKQLNLKELTTFTALTGWQSIKSILAFKHKTTFLKDYQTVIYSGIYAPVAIKNHPNTQNILYCHTPPRFVYDLKDYYWQQAHWWQKPLLNALRFYVKYHYEQAIKQMDIIIVNSKNVQTRIKHYLNQESIVIYPPIAIENFNWIEQGDYYLSVARVEQYKRIELIVRSFMEMPDKRLIVASGGSDLERLKNLSNGFSNIEYTGWCSEAQLHTLIGNCLATIYIPPDEDFGMSPVESMAAGKPVIGVAEGGLLETIVPHKTGFLIAPEPTQEQLKKAVYSMTAPKAFAMRTACEAQAYLFRTEVFIKKMKQLLK